MLDLEALANHRGSVLGLVPGSRQPSQKAFDSRVWDALRRLDPARPVFVESESKKIGDLRVPEALIARMRASPCLWLELALDRRVTLLMEEYDFFVRDIEAFCAALDALRDLRGHERGRRAGRRPRAPADAADGRARPADGALRPDLPAVDAAQFSAGRGAQDAERLEWDGGEASLAAAARRSHRTSTADRYSTGTGPAGLMTSSAIIDRTSSTPAICISRSVRNWERLRRSCATTFSR